VEQRSAASSEQEQERRGEEARRILNDPIYREAWGALRETLTKRLESEPLTAQQRLEIVDLLIANRKARVYMEQVLVTGTFAAAEQERKRTLRERLLRRA